MQTNQFVEEGKTAAIISYITLIGLVVAIVLNKDVKNSFASFHIRQSLGIVLLYAAVWMLTETITFVDSLPIIDIILYAGVFVLWLLGIISAVKGDVTPIPIFGSKFQEWFKGLS